MQRWAKVRARLDLRAMAQSGGFMLSVMRRHGEALGWRGTLSDLELGWVRRDLEAGMSVG